MTSISYDNIFSYFLGSITDYGIASLSTSDAYEIMTEQLHKTIADPFINKIFKSIEFDDVVQTLNYEMDYVVNDSADLEFVKLILSKGMIKEWLEPQVKSKINLAQYFGGKEQSFFSQANHISELRGIYNDTTLEIRKMIRDRGYINNSYLEDKS